MQRIESGNGNSQDLKKEVDLLLTMGNASKALSLIDEAIQADPSDWYLVYLKGWVHQSDNHAAEALNSFQKAEKLAPDNMQLKAKIGELLVARGEMEPALPYLAPTIQTWPDSSEAHSLYGIALLRLDNYEDAEQVLQKSCQLSEFNPDARLGLIELYTLTSRHQLIELQLKDYLQSASELASPYCFMADYLYLQEGNCEAACSFYEKALLHYEQSKNPGWYKQYLSTSNYPDTILDSFLYALLNCGNFDLIREVARNHLVAAQSRFWESIIYQRQGEVGYAIDSIQEALGSSPSNPAFRAKYAEYLLFSGEPKAAEDEIKAVIGDAPELRAIEPWYEGLLAAALIAQNREDEADEYLDKVISENRDRVVASIIHHLAELRRWSEVVPLCQKLLQSDTGNSHALHFLAKAYRGLNQYSESIDIYNQLIQQQPKNGPIQIELGLVYEKAGFTKEGIRSLEHSLNGNYLSHPHRAEARKALIRLRNQKNSS